MDPTFDDILRLVLILVVVVLPALAVTLAITARFAVRPIVEAIARLRELSSPQPNPTQLESRIAGVEQELRQLQAGFERLATAVEFDEQLRGGQTGNVPRLPQA